MHYAISDIHGEADRYFALKEAIGFSPADTLYILGDMIDRGPNGLDIVRDVMAHENIVALLGNHEQMCLDTLGPNNVWNARALWTSNGGNVTRRELLYLVSPAERHRILRYLAGLLDHLDITVNGRQFHLVHAWPGEDLDTRIWARPFPDTLSPFEDGRTVIVGHTPVWYLSEPSLLHINAYILDLESRGETARIAHCKEFIGIDCGCGHPTTIRRLGCLRLEDMEEFYV